jgi:beta-lactamase regulating signal transducer with metallopeptidase domain
METISHYLLTFLINSLWQVPLVAAVAALACRVMRKGPANHRHAIWVAALGAAVLLPLASVEFSRAHNSSDGVSIQPLDTARQISRVPLPAALAPLPASPSAPAPHNWTVSFANATAALLLSAYLLFLLFRMTRLVSACIRTAQIRRASAPAERSTLLQAVWTRSEHALGVRGVQLLASSHITGPLMAGAWSKIIVLPNCLLAEQSEDVLTTAIGHEMAHIARHDFALNLLYELLFLPVAFHPAAIVIRRGIERTRELACDELVTRRLIDPSDYARSIMSIAAGITGLPRPGYTLGVFDGDILEERIKRLLERPAANLMRARLLLATGLTALAVCVVIASGLSLTARAQSSATSETKVAGEAYNNGDFKSAVEHFENAVRSDPANINAKLFLANALMREFLSEQGPPDSPLIGGARQQYLDVLSRDAKNKRAIQGLIALDMQGRQITDARKWAQELIDLDPNDAAGYYSAGALDWAAAYPEFSRAKQAAGMRIDSYVIPDPEWRKRLRDQISPQIEEGLRILRMALQLDPGYTDAMA